MSGIYDQTKNAPGQHQPLDSIATEFRRTEPLISAKRLREDFLFGLPLVSLLTQQVMTDSIIERQIETAVSDLELESHLNFFPTQIQERQAFDLNEYKAMGYMRLRNKPVSSIERLSIFTSNDQELWNISIDWIDTGYLHQGLVYIVPINVAVATSSGSGGAAGGAAFLAILGQQSYVPAYWRVTYTTGWPKGAFPRAANTLIGCQAAINVLNLLAATHSKSTSRSLGIGGLSQSSGGPGPQLYDTAIKALTDRKQMALKKYRALFGSNILVGNI